MLLMRVKLNMVQVKDNYGDKGVCRLCGGETETTEHLGLCHQISGRTVREIREN